MDEMLTLRDINEALAAMGQRAFDSTPTNVVAVRYDPVGQGKIVIETCLADTDLSEAGIFPRRD